MASEGMEEAGVTQIFRQTWSTYVISRCNRGLRGDGVVVRDATPPDNMPPELLGVFWRFKAVLRCSG
jgi:hypothetical protein